MILDMIVFGLAGWGLGLLMRHVLFKRVPPQVARWLMMALVFIATFVVAILFGATMRRSYPWMVMPMLATWTFWLGMMNQKERSPAAPSLGEALAKRPASAAAIAKENPDSSASPVASPVTINEDR